MLTLTLLSQKGGAGKTTLACALAVVGEQAGHPAVIIDLDPQGSASTWGELRGDTPPVVTATTPERLPAVVAAARNAGAGLIVIDTAPNASDNAVLRATRAADLVLIPCRPSAADLSAIGVSIKIAQRAKTDAHVVINAAPVRNPLIEQAQEAIVGYDIEAVPVVVHQRIDHVHAFTIGQTAREAAPKGKAAREIAALFDWIAQRQLL